MPTYQYACTTADCGEKFELVQSFTDPSASECPVCAGPVRKVYSAVGVVFKGSGFYRNDSRSGSGEGKSSKESANKESSSKDSSAKESSTKDSSSKESSSSSTSSSDKASASSGSSASSSSSSSGSGSTGSSSSKAAAGSTTR